MKDEENEWYANFIKEKNISNLFFKKKILYFYYFSDKFLNIKAII